MIEKMKSWMPALIAVATPTPNELELGHNRQPFLAFSAQKCPCLLRLSQQRHKNSCGSKGSVADRQNQRGSARRRTVRCLHPICGLCLPWATRKCDSPIRPTQGACRKTARHEQNDSQRPPSFVVMRGGKMLPSGNLNCRRLKALLPMP